MRAAVEQVSRPDKATRDNEVVDAVAKLGREGGEAVFVLVRPDNLDLLHTAGDCCHCGVHEVCLEPVLISRSWGGRTMEKIISLELLRKGSSFRLATWRLGALFKQDEFQMCSAEVMCIELC